MIPYIIDTGSDDGAWADALRFAPFPVEEYRPRLSPPADDASGCGFPVRALTLRMDGQGVNSFHGDDHA